METQSGKELYCNRKEYVVAYAFLIGSLLFVIHSMPRKGVNKCRVDYVLIGSAILFVIGSIPMVIDLYVDCKKD